jgi:hypothetical protein
MAILSYAWLFNTLPNALVEIVPAPWPLWD